MRMFRKSDEGFTLVELMVVVLIIGILVAIAIPVFNAARANAQQKSCFANQRTVDGSARQYQAENNVLPATVGLLVPMYIKAEPTCPVPGNTYAWNATAGELSCAGTDAHVRYDAP